MKQSTLIGVAVSVVSAGVIVAVLVKLAKDQRQIEENSKLQQQLLGGPPRV